MKIVIDLPVDLYCEIHGFKTIYDERIREIADAICNSTPLPKGHGRLIDADALLKEHKFFDAYPFPSTAIDNAPTIIEADKEGGDNE